MRKRLDISFVIETESSLSILAGAGLLDFIEAGMRENGVELSEICPGATIKITDIELRPRRAAKPRRKAGAK